MTKRQRAVWRRVRLFLDTLENQGSLHDEFDFEEFADDSNAWEEFEAAIFREATKLRQDLDVVENDIEGEQ